MTRLTILTLALAVSFSDATCSRPAPTNAYNLKSVGRNVWAAIDNPNSRLSAGANAGFVVGDQAVAVIDTFANIDAARQLDADIRKLTRLPIKFVVNTHYHLDHVAGNGVFVQGGAVVVAQRNVRDWIHAENLRLITDGLASAHQTMSAEQKASIDGLVAPTAVYDGSVDLDIGGRQLLVRSFPGHTGSDSTVFIPDANVAFTGDLFWHNNVPNTVDASTKPWINTLNALADTRNGYTFVAGHGDIGNVKDVLAFRDYLDTLRSVVANAQTDGKTGEAVVNMVLPELARQYGQWSDFSYVAPMNIRQTDAELRGMKSIPQPHAN